MMRIAIITKLTPSEVIKKAINFFGPDGYKLKIADQTETSANFEGGRFSQYYSLRRRWQDFCGFSLAGVGLSG